MKTPLAWHKVTHNKVRNGASLVGVSFAIVLIFMQLGFYDACFRSSTMVLDQLDFDIALMSSYYHNLRVSDSIPRRRLDQARSIHGVASAAPFYVGNGFWHEPRSHLQREIMVLGFDPRQPTFKVPELENIVQQLRKEDTAIWDTKAQWMYEKIQPGMLGQLEDQRLEVVATYPHGTGFISPATLLVSDQTLSRCFRGTPLEKVNLGLVRLKPGEDVERVVRDLIQELPPDTLVKRRPELEAIEQHYFMMLKPIGIMFGSGVLLALVVGAVIIYQILSSEVMNYLKEYATLRAIGYSKRFVNGVVLQQSALFALIGYVPAAAMAAIMFVITKAVTGLPMELTWDRLLLVLLLSLGMCAFSGLLAIRKVSRADPVDLF